MGFTNDVRDLVTGVLFSTDMFICYNGYMLNGGEGYARTRYYVYYILYKNSKTA